MVPFFCLTVYIATKSKIESRAHYAPKKTHRGPEQELMRHENWTFSSKYNY